MGKKIQKNNKYLLDFGDKLLLNDNIEIYSKNQIIKTKNKKKVITQFLLYFIIILKIIF